jgi:hypothetical protein
MKKETKHKIVATASFIGKGILLGVAYYTLSRVIDQRDAYRALYTRECEVYVDLARKCGVANSGDHTSIVKTIFKDGTEFLAENAKAVKLS